MREQILKAFRFLFEELGFVFLDEHGLDAETVVVAGSQDMRIRFIKDRADFFVDVASTQSPDVWTGLYDVLDILKPLGKVAEGYKYANKMESQSKALRKNFDVVRDYLASS